MNRYVAIHPHQRAALALASVVSTLAVMSAVLLMFDIEPGDPVTAGASPQAVTAQAAAPSCLPDDESATDACVPANSGALH